MTSSSEQTTALIAEARKIAQGTSWPGNWTREMVGRLADALEAASNENARLSQQSQSGPRVVSTVAELDALPELTVVRSSEGGIWEAYGEEKFRQYLETGSSRYHDAEDIAFPATVLWVGGTE